jgi:uncharacterized protein (TIGR00251 family)
LSSTNAAVTLESIRNELAAKGVVRLRVKVTPKAGKSELHGWLADGTLKARVRAAPEKGKANAELCELLAQTLGVRRAQIEVISGASSTLKLILVRS